MGFGPHSDFDHFGKGGHITADEVASGLGMLVLCEGCGPTRVDHLGRCLGECDEQWCRNADGSLSEVSRKAEGWLARRAGRLGWLYRSWDWWAGTPWEPGQVHYLRWRYRDWRAGEDTTFGGSVILMEGFEEYVATEPLGAGTRNKDDRGTEGKEPEKDGLDPSRVSR